MDELAEHTQKHYGERPKCPKCGKEAIAAKCGHCGKVYPQARGEQICLLQEAPDSRPAVIVVVQASPAGLF